MRFGASFRLRVRGRADEQGVLRLVLSEPLVDAITLNHIAPAPVVTRATPDGIEYGFSAPPGAAVATVFDAQPIRRWKVDVAVRTGTDVVQFWLFIFP